MFHVSFKTMCYFLYGWSVLYVVYIFWLNLIGCLLKIVSSFTFYLIYQFLRTGCLSPHLPLYICLFLLSVASDFASCSFKFCCFACTLLGLLFFSWLLITLNWAMPSLPLKSILSDVNVATHSWFLWLMFSWYIFLIFNFQPTYATEFEVSFFINSMKSDCVFFNPLISSFYLVYI